VATKQKPEPEPNRPAHELHLRLRATHIHSLTEMFRVGGGSLTFEDFCAQVFEAAIADFKLARVGHESRSLPYGAPVSAPTKHRKKLAADDIETIRFLRESEKLSTGQLANRYGTSQMTIRRYLTEDD
jgi:hypothetical protein